MNGNLAGSYPAIQSYIQRMNSDEYPDPRNGRGIFANIDYKFTSTPADRVVPFSELRLVRCEQLCEGGKMAAVKLHQLQKDALAEEVPDLHISPADFHRAVQVIIVDFILFF